MGLADRSYQQRANRRGEGLFAQISPVVKWLLISNLVIFFIDLFFLGHRIQEFGAFTIETGIFGGRIWEFVSFQFLHGSLGHVMFNCIGIFFFGPPMERWWGSRKFTLFYLLCGVGGAVFYSLLVFVGILPSNDFYTPLVGASAGIYGILIGIAVIAPNLRVALLFPPIELSMRQMAIALMAISVGSILLKLGGNEGGEAGHLGGAIFGYLLMRYPKLLGAGDVIIIPPPLPNASHPAKIRPRSDLFQTQDSVIDAILDKISSDGFQSLTEEERAILQQAASQKKSSHD